MPPAIASVVATATESPIFQSLNELILPILNPNHPTAKIHAPRTAKGTLCPAIGMLAPFLYFPILAPIMYAAVNPIIQPNACTTAEPAKS